MISISVDTPQDSQHLRKTAGYTFPILSDANDSVNEGAARFRSPMATGQKELLLSELASQ